MHAKDEKQIYSLVYHKSMNEKLTQKSFMNANNTVICKFKF